MQEIIATTAIIFPDGCICRFNIDGRQKALLCWNASINLMEFKFTAEGRFEQDPEFISFSELHSLTGQHVSIEITSNSAGNPTKAISGYIYELLVSHMAEEQTFELTVKL